MKNRLENLIDFKEATLSDFLSLRKYEPHITPQEVALLICLKFRKQKMLPYHPIKNRRGTSITGRNITTSQVIGLVEKIWGDSEVKK